MRPCLARHHPLPTGPPQHRVGAGLQGPKGASSYTSTRAKALRRTGCHSNPDGLRHAGLRLPSPLARLLTQRVALQGWGAVAHQVLGRGEASSCLVNEGKGRSCLSRLLQEENR